MTRRNHFLLLLALGVPGLAGGLTALPLSGGQHWLLLLALGAMFIWGPAIFLTRLISLFGT
jgi:hypothetical protein